MNQAELEEDIERFTGNFLERVAEASARLDDSDRLEVRDQGLRRQLLYSSSAVDIASGTFPEVDLLDMLVFLRLCKRVLEEHWIPEVFGEAGRDLAEAFASSEKELWDVADKILSPSQRKDVIALIDDWRAENPKQVRVEGVRFLAFSRRAGAMATERADRASGLMSSVKSATQKADQALLLGERAMFLVHRMPFLIRLQARLAAKEIVSDTLAVLRERAERMLSRRG